MMAANPGRQSATGWQAVFRRPALEVRRSSRMASSFAYRQRAFSTLPTLLILATRAAPAASGPQQYLRKPDDWFAGEEAKRIAANILSYQSDLGGWPKNIDTTAAAFTGDRKELKGTFDNDATTDELRFLSRIYRATKDDSYKKAFEKGIDHMLAAKNPTDGWPQT